MNSKRQEVKSLRLIQKKTTIEDGEYTGAITKASIYTNDKGNEFLWLTVTIPLDDGEVQLIYSLPLYFYEGTLLYKVIEKLERLPEIGDDLELDSLVGLKVKVTVENNYANNRQYSNIIDISLVRDDPASVKRMLKTPRKVVVSANVKKTSTEYDYDYPEGDGE